jgi:hypothetical protein
MVSSSEAFKKYGEPGLLATQRKNMVMWDVPAELEIGAVPKRLYCNKDMVKPLEEAFTNLVQRNHVNELKTWDGCFNIRKKRGLTSMSLHSWGIAIDVNAFENGLNQIPKLSSGFVKCFTDAGFDWGGEWQRLDGMHFQLKTI